MTDFAMIAAETSNSLEDEVAETTEIEEP